MINKLVYAGSFDLLTNGHLWMIESGAKIAEKLIVAVGINPAKKGFMPVEDRVRLLEQVIKSTGLENVVVDSFEDRYLVNYAKYIGADTILRGIRNPIDLEFEMSMRYINADLEPSIRSVYLFPPQELLTTSSSMVKGLIGPQGWKSVVKKYVPRPVFEHLLMKTLVDRFRREWQAAGGKEAYLSADDTFHRLASHYSASNRHYHTLEHISACLDEIDSYPGRTPVTFQFSYNAICLAIFFHDVIYNPQKDDNESQSALFFKELAEKAGLNQQTIEAVVEMIEATKGHVSHSYAVQLMLDIDLSILGKSHEEFDEYDRNIRKEYSHVPDILYNAGRKKFMTEFAKRERLFKTQFFHDKYEKAAKDNLNRLLNR